MINNNGVKNEKKYGSNNGVNNGINNGNNSNENNENNGNNKNNSFHFNSSKFNGYNVGFFFMFQFLWFNFIYIVHILFNESKILFTDLERGLRIYNGFLDDDVSESETEESLSKEKEKVERVEIKYEDKYLDIVNSMSSAYIFSLEESKLIEKKTIEFLESLRIDLNSEKERLNLEIVEKGLEYIDIDELETSENMDSLKKDMLVEIDKLRVEVAAITGKLDNYIDLHKDALDKATKFVIKERLDSLKNSFIIEKTPLGNVIMYYNNERNSFEYYTDNTIPYRFLETVGRKYITVFNCKQIYVDMANELKEAERKLKEKEELEKREREEKENGSDIVVAKKNVFTKFKSYNKDAGTGRVNMAAPPKNSIPNNSNIGSVKPGSVKESGGLKASGNNGIDGSENNDRVLLKENTNRYTCMGRVANFNILKKIDRKVVDKKYAMTFADFKKLKKENLVK